MDDRARQNHSRRPCERAGKEGNTPVDEMSDTLKQHPKYNGGATRIVTGPDTGESTRLDTRPTTRLGGGNVPGTGVSAGPSAGLSTGNVVAVKSP
jgi:hypothetical protein